MSTETSLGPAELAERFRGIALQKQNGLLTLIQEKNAIFIHVKNGEIIRAWEGNEDEIFAEALIKSKKIVKAQLETALRIQGNIKQPFVRVLLDMGYLTSDEIKGIHRVVLEEILYSLYAWKSGHCRFEAQEITYDTDLIEPLSLFLVLSEWEHQAARWQALRLNIPSPQMVFEVVPGTLIPPLTDEVEAMEDLERTRVLYYPRHDDTQSKITRTIQQLQPAPVAPAIEANRPSGNWLLPFINGQRTVQEIIQQAGDGDSALFSVYEGLSDLLLKGSIFAQATSQPEPSAPAPVQPVRTESTDILEATSLPSGMGTETNSEISSIFTLSKWEETQRTGTTGAGTVFDEEPLEKMPDLSEPSARPARDELDGPVRPVGPVQIANRPDDERTEDSEPARPVREVEPAREEPKESEGVSPYRSHRSLRPRVPFRIEFPAFSAMQLRFFAQGFLGLLVVAVLIFSRSFMFAAFSVPQASSDAIQRLLMYNEEDLIRSALELYYLEHRGFPKILQTLKTERFLGTPKEQAIDLSQWNYQSAGVQFNLSKRIAQKNS